jgi:hypothetical protein
MARDRGDRTGRASSLKPECFISQIESSSIGDSFRTISTHTLDFIKIHVSFSVVQNSCDIVEIDERHSLEIDSPNDLDLARLLYKHNKSN